MDSKKLIREFIQTELVKDKKFTNLEDDTPLLDTGIVDSLGVMRLVGFLEDDLSTVLDDSELIPENFSTIEAISSLVHQKAA